MVRLIAICALLTGCATTVPQPEMRVNAHHANPACILVCRIVVVVHDNNGNETAPEMKEKDDAP